MTYCDIIHSVNILNNARKRKSPLDEKGMMEVVQAKVVLQDLLGEATKKLEESALHTEAVLTNLWKTGKVVEKSDKTFCKVFTEDPDEDLIKSIEESKPWLGMCN